MSSTSIDEWKTFFLDAGLKEVIALTYAKTFNKNRIDLSRDLAELSKEYLCLMNITAVGDIISILRHSKYHIENNLQLDDGIKKVAPSSTSSSPPAKIPAKTPAKTPRRVLPEHEGKYIITLPSGKNPKSRAALKAMKPVSTKTDKLEKKSIFDRLTSSTHKVSDLEISSTSSESLVKTKTTPSIFNRLGNYKELELETVAQKSIAFSGILKSLPKSKGIVKVKQHNSQRTLRREKPLLKTNTESDAMELDKRQSVTFSEAVTLRVYQPQNLIPEKIDRPVKGRLGSVKKVTSSPPVRLSKMKSDRMLSTQSVHSRLTFYNSKPKSVFKRLGE